jgi:small subunit ribosomal protein S21
MTTIKVYNNELEQALKVLKRQLLKEGLFKELKRRSSYEKPSERKKRKNAEATKRIRKAVKRTV